MANFSKAFNFRGGFQVDTDVLVVRGPGVGIGSTQPTANLDVANLARFNNQVTVGYGTFNNLRATGIITGDYTDAAGIVSISNGVITSRTPGEVVTYFGDGVNLLNLPTSQWIDIDPGLGFTSIYAQGPVGVSTNDPRFDFQVGGPPFGFRGSPINQNGVGINSAGNIFATGIVSVTGTTGFAGTGTQLRALNASELTVGAIPSDAYDTLIITTEVQADRFTGTADFADDLSLDAETQFAVGIANTLSALNRFLSPTGKIQLGSDDIDTNAADIEITRTFNSTILSRSTAGNARVFAGLERPNGVGVGANFGYGGLVFGSGDTLLPSNGPSDLAFVNYDVGNINYFLNAGNQTPFDGQYRWYDTQNLLAVLDNTGQFTLFDNGVQGSPLLNCLGIATFQSAFTEFDFEVNQDLTVNRDLSIGGDLSIEGTINIDTILLNNAVFSGIVSVGGNVPNQIGLKFDGSNGDLETNGDIRLYSGLVETTTITPTSATIGGNVSGTGDATFNSGTVSGNILNSQSTIQNPNFSVDVNGVLQTESATVNDLTADNDTNLTNLVVTGTAGFAGLTANGTISATSVETTQLEAEAISLPGGSTVLNVPPLSGSTIDLSGNIDALSANIQTAEIASIVEASSIQYNTVNNQFSIGPDPASTGDSSLEISASTISIGGTSTFSDNINVESLLLTTGEIGVGIQTVPDGAAAPPTIPFNPDEPPGPNNPLVFTETTMSISIQVEDGDDPLNSTFVTLSFNQLGTNLGIGFTTLQLTVATP